MFVAIEPKMRYAASVKDIENKNKYSHCLKHIVLNNNNTREVNKGFKEM